MLVIVDDAHLCWQGRCRSQLADFISRTGLEHLDEVTEVGIARLGILLAHHGLAEFLPALILPPAGGPARTRRAAYHNASG
jgi:hypothetical protein